MGQVDFWTVTLFRGLTGTGFSLLSVFLRKKRVSPLGTKENYRMLSIRGLLGGITIATAFYAIASMDLAQASVIIFTGK